MSSHTDVAIVGLSGRFPGAPDVRTFWKNLCASRETISSFDANELAAAGEGADAIRSPEYVAAAGVVDAATLFDASFFGLSRREAILLDPQHRVALEEGWLALEDAGHGRRTAAARIGVFAACSSPTWGARGRTQGEQVGDYLQNLISLDKDFLATRIAYKLNLTGPAMTVQTACSSSLVAVHVACQSLLDEDCDAALAGGISLRFPERAGYLRQEGGILSADGHCRSYDADATGTVPSAGGAFVVLRRLEDALADGDHVYAVVKGSAINNDGALKVGYTAPSADGQRAVIADALAVADVAPASIGYVEGHGTATPLGDPVEVQALAEAFAAGGGAPRGGCVLGSVKSNIGHVDVAAGIAGLVKAALAVLHGVVPGTVGFRRPNPALELDETPFRITGETAPWPREGVRRAGVSSFGIGGTNAHVVLEQAPEPTRRQGRSGGRFVLAVSARSPAALARAREELATRLEDEPELAVADVAFTLAVGRTPFPYRAAETAATSSAAVRALRRERPAPAEALESPRLAYLFPGQGAPLDGAAACLLRQPAARREYLRAVSLVQPHLDFDLRRALEDSEGVPVQTSVVQPALFVLELALARTWRSRGVAPRWMLGHSVGELVAATLCGVFTEEDGARICAVRGALMEATPDGAMTAVLAEPAVVEPRLGEDLRLAAINSFESCVVSGALPALEEFERAASADGLSVRRLPTAKAFHSPLVEPALEAFRAELERTPLAHPHTPFGSNVSGSWAVGDEVATAEYWVEHARRPVRFADGLLTLAAGGASVFAEVGPGRILGNLVTRTLGAGEERVRVVSSLVDGSAVEDGFAALWETGVELELVEPASRVSLPGYPFEREPAEMEKNASAEAPPDTRARKVALYAPGWTRTARRATADPAAAYWILLGRPAATASLADELHARGAGVAAVDPEAGAGLHAPFSALDVPRDVPLRIVLLPPAEPEPLRSFSSLVDAARAADLVWPRRPSSLDVVTTGDPASATAAAAANVASAELPQLAWRAVQVSRADRTSGPIVLEGLLFAASGDTLARRAGTWWTRRFARLPRAKPRPPLLRTGGVYLVTGGLGGIGSAIAEHLHDDWDAQLVLMSRSGTSSSPRVDRLRRDDARVAVVRGDAASPADAASAVAAARARFGTLDGVIHAAGVPGGGVVGRLEAEAAEAVFRPKVDGGQAVLEAVAGERLDVVCLCSSISALAAEPGTAAYAAANAFLDAVAESRNPDDETPVVSIAWDTWTESGMAVEAVARGDLPAASLATGLSDAEGVRAFDAALAAGSSHVVVVAGDLEERLETLAAARVAEAPPREEAPRASAPDHSEPTLQDKLAAAWADVLGLQDVPRDRPFADLGGNSLLAMQAATRLGTRFGLSLSIDAILSADSLAALAAETSSSDSEDEPTDRLQLLCFPWAGASHELYLPWRDLLPEEVRVAPVPYPGRDGASAPHRRLDALVEALVDAHAAALPESFALFGHSLGGLVAFEFARALRRNGLPEPQHLFVSACAPPEVVASETSLHDLPDATLVEELARLEGLPAETLASDGFRELYLPLVRADLEVFGTYRYRDEPALELPLTVFGGLDDPAVDPDGLDGWARHTHGPFHLSRYQGGHFFLHEHVENVLDEVVQPLRVAVQP